MWAKTGFTFRLEASQHIKILFKKKYLMQKITVNFFDKKNGLTDPTEVRPIV